MNRKIEIVSNTLREIEVLRRKSKFVKNLLAPETEIEVINLEYLRLYTSITEQVLTRKSINAHEYIAYEEKWAFIKSILEENDTIKPPTDVIISLNKIQNLLNQYNRVITGTVRNHIISEFIDAFLNEYNDWLENSNNSYKKKLIIFHKYNILSTTLQSIIYDIKLIENLSIESINISKLENGVTLYFESSNRMDEFIIKLNSIKIIYNEICELFSISTNDEPLRLIETQGKSKFIAFIGNLLGIKVLSNLLYSGVKYIHRNYTKEGKLNSIPTKVQDIERVLALSQQMEEAGIDTSKMKENISKSGVKISKELNKLLGKEELVIINDERYIAGKQNQKIPLLNSGSEDLLEQKSKAKILKKKK